MRVENSPRGVNLNFVVVTVVARIPWLEHDLDGGGAAPQVGIRIVASKGRDRVTIGHHETEVEAFVIPADTGRGRNGVARRYPPPVIRVDERPEHRRRPPHRLVEAAINHRTRGEAGNPRRRAADGAIAQGAVTAPTTHGRKHEK